MAEPRNRYPQWDEEIVSLYKDNYSIREIAKIIGWSPKFVRNRLIWNKVQMRSRGGNRRRNPVPRGEYILLKHLYVVRKMSLAEIAKVRGVSSKTIARRLKAAGVEIRPRGQQPKRP